jgi:hypothetical protein
MRRRGIGGPGRGIARGPVGRMAARMAVRVRSRRRRRRRRRRIILAGGAIALGTAAVHKYSKKDVERIEAQTGKPAEELTDDELTQASQQLGIQPQEMSDEEWDQVEASDAQEDAEYPDDAEPAAAEPAAQPAAAQPDYLDQLQRLGDLRDKGILTDEEFEAKKKQILDQM